MNDLQELSTFSHEINNSLTLIYGQIQCIEKTVKSVLPGLIISIKNRFASLFRQTPEPLFTFTVQDQNFFSYFII